MIEVVNANLLVALAATAPATHPFASGHKPAGQTFDLEGWIARHRLEVDGPEPWQGGRKWAFRVCPWNSDHTNRSAFIVQQASGAIAAGCHHNSCQGKGWHDLRDLVEAGWRDNKRTSVPPRTAHRELPVPRSTFPLDALPSTIATYVREASVAIGCDPSFVALPLLACLAAAIGNKRTIKLKRNWFEPAIIWAAIVGKSGTHKSPALQAATSFLARKQAEAIEQYQRMLIIYKQDLAIYERDNLAWKRTKGTEQPPWEPKVPTCQRYICSDITIEALADRLSDQFDGVLVVRDELAGWLDGIAEYKGGRGSDTGHWLACWSAAPLTNDRKTGTKPMIHVPRAGVSIVGGIQPAILRRAMKGEHMKDGMCSRLLVAMPEICPIRWSEAVVSPTTETALEAVFDKLLSLEPAADGEGHAAPFAIPLSSEAKAVWVEFYNRHRAEIVDLDDDLAAAWSKLEAYAARFALIVQLCSWASGEGSADEIDEESIAAGIALCDWFGAETKHVYAVLAESPELTEQLELVNLIKRKGGSITPRQLAHAYARYRAPGKAEAALESLIKAQWGRWEIKHRTGGRPANMFVLSDSNGNGTPE